MPEESTKEPPVWTPTKHQSLYRHRNGRYYARTFAGGKEEWRSLRTTLLSVAKHNIKPYLEANETRKSRQLAQATTVRMTFGQALEQYREKLNGESARPGTLAFKEAGIKLVLKTWPGIEAINIRKIGEKEVADWLRRFYAEAKPHVPTNAKRASKISTGASPTTVKCALGAIRAVLDVAVESGLLYANPARNSSVTLASKKILRSAERKKAEKGGLVLPTAIQFKELVETIRNFRVGDCEAAADFVEFLAYCGARKTEAANVVWRDVSFDRGQIQLRVTKNGQSRVVPMIPDMRTLLKRMKTRQTLVTPTDRVLLVKEAQGFITSACKTLDLPRITTHSLRHLFGTVCLESGVEVRTVAEWLGHKDNGTLLLRTYSHVRRDHEEKMAQKVHFSSPETTPEVTPSQ